MRMQTRKSCRSRPRPSSRTHRRLPPPRLLPLFPRCLLPRSRLASTFSRAPTALPARAGSPLLMRIVSLFDASGTWSKPYTMAGYEVIQVDLSRGQDIMTWEPPEGRVHGVLAAPPCTHFTGAGARHWHAFDSSGKTKASVALLYRTLSLIIQMEPEWWVLENPVGRLNSLVPELADFGPRYFQPCDYGDPYTKKTGLWGDFTMPPKSPITPTLGSLIHNKMGSSDPRRSITPTGFAVAFFKANP